MADVDLDVLSETIDRLQEAGPSVYGDCESIEALHRLRARLEAFVTEATACFDTAGNWVPDGAHGARAWLMARCHLSPSEAGRVVRRGRMLRNLPGFARAWEKGSVTAAHVDTAASLCQPGTMEALGRDEDLLVTQAAALPHRGFECAAAYWRQLADPNGAEDDDEERRGRRDVYLEKSFGGMWLGQVTLDPVSGAIVGGELARLERALFEADWAEAKAAAGGSDPNPSDLGRTTGQRRADALVEMATRSRAMPEGARRPAPLFSVLVDYGAIVGRVCELADGTVLAPGALVPWMSEAYFERVVFAPARRVEVSEKARLFTGATRRAIELRDRQCRHPYCDVPAADSQADHVVPYTSGGATVQENGQMLCGFHNRLRIARPPPDEW